MYPTTHQAVPAHRRFAAAAPSSLAALHLGIACLAWGTAGCGDDSGAGGNMVADGGDGDGSGTGGMQMPPGDGDGSTGGRMDGSGGTQDGGTGGTGDSGGSGGMGAGPDPLSTDRADFFGDSRCQGADDLLLCDGFEAADIDGNIWQQQGNGSVTIDASQAARGARSALVHTAENGFAFLRHSGIFPVQDNRYYGRMFVRFAALPVAPLWAHWTIAEASGGGDGSLIRVGGQWDGNLNRVGVGSDGGPTGDWTWLDDDPQGAAVEPAANTWMCIEWLHDGQNDVTRLWWDGVEHPSLATTADDHGGNGVPYVMPDFESVWVGWWLYQGNPTPSAYDVWIDEVSLDDTRIGCAR